MSIRTKLGIVKDYFDPRLPKARDLLYDVHCSKDEVLRIDLKRKKRESMIRKSQVKYQKKYDKLIKQGKYGQAVKLSSISKLNF